MRKFITAATGAAILATAGLAATAPAEAQRWGGGYRGGWHGGGYGYRGWHHHGGVGAGTAVAAGILGLGIGAAIASDHSRRYDDGGYYGGGYYAYAPPPPPPPPVYYVPAPYGYYGGYYGY